MATKSEAGQLISEIAKAEGGTTKGSASAQLQSEVTKQQQQQNDATSNVTQQLKAGLNISEDEVRHMESEQHEATGIRPPSGSAPAVVKSDIDKEKNFGEATSEIAEKILVAPETISQEDASHIHRREQRAHGVTEKGGITSETHKLADENENPQNTTSSDTSSTLSPQEQSEITKEQNFEEAANVVGSKIVNAPETVTKEDAGYLHSREQRAHGTTEKGGITSEAHKLADQNEGR